jgi:lipocalin
MYQTLNEDPDSPLARALRQPKFPPGQILATPGALAALEMAGCPVATLLARHYTGDWGDVPPEDARMNDAAVECGGRLLSSYALTSDVRIWVISTNYEGPENSTSVLLPSEY